MGSMKMVEDLDLASRYQAVRDELLGQRYSDRMSKPLAYWVLPSDRRLPLAFLNRSLGELLSTPFPELSATPGIGEKKINSLVKLLHRATHDEPPAVPVGGSEHEHPTQGAESGFDPTLVSEALWSDWRDVVRRHGVGDETLGAWRLRCRTCRPSSGRSRCPSTWTARWRRFVGCGRMARSGSDAC